MKRPMESFPTRLDALMKERSVDQSELARRTGLHPSAVSRWFAKGSTRRTATVANIGRVAEALGVDPAWEFIEFRRALLHRKLDEWIDQDEETVEFLLARLQPGQDRPQ